MCSFVRVIEAARERENLIRHDVFVCSYVCVRVWERRGAILCVYDDVFVRAYVREWQRVRWAA